MKDAINALQGLKSRTARFRVRVTILLRYVAVKRLFKARSVSFLIRLRLLIAVVLHTRTERAIKLRAV